MDLNKRIELIHAFGKDYNIPIVFGMVDEKNTPNVVWEKTSGDKNLNEYLQFCKSMDVRFFVVMALTNSGEDEFILPSFDFFEDKELIKEFKETLSDYKKHKGKVSHYFCYALLNSNIVVTFYEETGWSDLKDIIESYIEDINQQTHFASLSNGPKLKQSEIKKYAKMLVDDERFLLAKNEKQRNYIAADIFDDEIIENGNFQEVIWTATSIFELDVKPKLEKQKRKEVRELKAKGMKKSDIAAELDISIYEVDKYS